MHCTGVVLALLFWQVVAADYVDVEDEQVEPEPEPLVEAAAADGTVDSESSGLQLGDTLEGGENMHDASQPFSSAKAAVLHPLTADDRSRLESFFSTDVGAEAEHADHDDDNVLSVQTAAAYSIAAAVLNMEPVTKVRRHSPSTLRPFSRCVGCSTAYRTLSFSCFLVFFFSFLSSALSLSLFLSFFFLSVSPRFVLSVSHPRARLAIFRRLGH